MVKKMLPQAELYVCINEISNEIDGFIGLDGEYIAGIFVQGEAQAKGLGKALLNHAKNTKPALKLSVYEKNTKAISFYTHEGFVIQSDGTCENTGEKELTMAWAK